MTLPRGTRIEVIATLQDPDLLSAAFAAPTATPPGEREPAVERAAVAERHSCAAKSPRRPEPNGSIARWLDVVGSAVALASNDERSCRTIERRRRFSAPPRPLTPRRGARGAGSPDRAPHQSPSAAHRLPCSAGSSIAGLLRVARSRRSTCARSNR